MRLQLLFLLQIGLLQLNMTADPDNPGWFKYTFPIVSQVSFLFRDGVVTGRFKE